MRSESMAEWVLSRCTSGRKAASLVGDLMELREQRGRLWFWLVVAGSLVRLAWRRPVAWFAGFYAGAYAFAFFQMALWGIHVHHRVSDRYAWTPVFSLFNGCGAIVCLVLVYAGIRYGVRDRLTQLALVLAALSVPVAYWWWKPAVLIACLASISAVVVAALLQRAWRGALLVLAGVVAAGFAGGLLTGYLEDRYRNFLYAGPIGDREIRLHPSLAWLAVLLMAATAGMMMAICSRLHARLLAKPWHESQDEGLGLMSQR